MTTEKNSIYSQIELFIISAPLLLGGLLAIVRYKKDDPRFLLGFQNLLTFAIFIFLVSAAFITQKMTLFQVEILYYLQAGLSFLYSACNTTVALLAILKKKYFVAPGIQSLLDKVFRFIAQSVTTLN